MRKITLALSAALVALSAGSASADDLETRANSNPVLKPLQISKEKVDDTYITTYVLNGTKYTNYQVIAMSRSRGCSGQARA